MLYAYAIGCNIAAGLSDLTMCAAGSCYSEHTHSKSGLFKKTGVGLERRMLVQEPKRATPPRPTRRASMAFMEMLREARDPPVSTKSAWRKVAPQFEEDHRFQAVAEEQRQEMFETFLEALAKVEESKRQRRWEGAATDFKVRVWRCLTHPCKLLQW